MQKFFSQPFPLIESRKLKWGIIVTVSLFVLFFHAVFEPFGIRTYDEMTKFIVVSVYTLISALVLTINFLLIPKALPRIFQAEKWNTLKELIWITWNILTIALSTFYFKTSQGFYPANFTYLVNVIVSALAIGIIPASVYFLVGKMVYLKNSTSYVTTTEKENGIITLRASRGNGKVTFNVKKLLYIESNQNYIVIHGLREEETWSRKLRNSMNMVEYETNSYPSLFRCHRAFMINIDYIEAIEGNVKNCRVKLKGIAEPIPVSRSAVKELKDLWNQLK